MRIVLGDEGAVVQHQEAIDAGEQGMHDVLDPHDRYAAAPDVGDEVDQGVALALGQTAGDFVEQEYARTCGKRTR